MIRTKWLALVNAVITLRFCSIIIIIIIIIAATCLLLLSGVKLSLGGSSPYTSTDKTNKNKYT